MAVKERVGDFIEYAYLQHCLEENEYKLILINELNVTMKSSAENNWSPRNVPSIILIDPDPLIMNFIVKLSHQNFEGVMASTSWISKAMFTQFVYNV